MIPSRTILVADADQAWRSAIVEAVRHVGYAAMECATGTDALRLARRQRPGLAVIDVALPGIAGYELCHEFREEFGEGFPIIFVSADRTESFDRVGGLLLGADDYVVKPCAPSELLVRIRKLLPLRSPSRSASHVLSLLTAREAEVLRLLATGSSTQEIADELVISIKTVGGHIERILTKLGVHSQAQAVATAYREGIVESKSARPPKGSLRYGTARFSRPPVSSPARRDQEPA